MIELEGKSLQTEGLIIILVFLDLLWLINPLNLDSLFTWIPSKWLQIPGLPSAINTLWAEGSCLTTTCKVPALLQVSILHGDNLLPSSPSSSCAASTSFTFFRKTLRETISPVSLIIYSHTKVKRSLRSASFYTFSILQGNGENLSQDQRWLLGEQSRWMATKTQKWGVVWGERMKQSFGTRERCRVWNK